MKDRVANPHEGIAHLRKQLKEIDFCGFGFRQQKIIFTLLRKCENRKLDADNMTVFYPNGKKLSQPFEWIMKQMVRRFTSGQA